jgi:hypothetical protein
MMHFSDHELARWSAQGPGADRARLIDHLRECGACATRYADAVRIARLGTDVAASTEDPSEFVAAAHALVEPARRRVAWVGAAAAAAAAVAVAVLLPRGDRAPANATSVQLRGSGVTALTPNGEVDRVSEFVWTSGLVAPRYIVEVGDDRGVVFTTTTTEPKLDATSAARDLRAGGTYWWTVTAVDADGQRMATSPRREFRIRQP